MYEFLSLSLSLSLECLHIYYSLQFPSKGWEILFVRERESNLK